MTINHSTLDSNQTVSKFFNRKGDVSNNLSTLDYTNTRFHNILVSRQDHTLVVAETLEAQQQQRAFDKAKEAVMKRGQEEAEKQNKKALDEQKAKERG